MTGKEIMELAARVAEDWKDDPNVVGVGFGVRHRGGKREAGPVLRFTVKRKLATEKEIRAIGSRPIPYEIEGVPTDVNVVEEAPAILPGWNRDSRREEPLKGGVSTGPMSSAGYPFPEGGGTLGGVCILDDGSERLMALSNAHVWGFSIGVDIVQPIIPVGELLEAGVKLLSCGPVISYLSEPVLPSGLTLLLTAAATGAWTAAVASDAKDPHRRGEEATVPDQPDELTISESVQFEAQPKDVPLPGTPFQADVAWKYERRTDQATYPFAVNETRVNEHVLVRKQIWTDQSQYPAGNVVEILALIETARAARPDAFHVVAHLASTNQPERRVTRVLRPAVCDRTPFLCVNFPKGKPNTEAQFPIHEQGVTFQADRPGIFRGSQEGPVGLQFPGEGLEINVPPSLRADLLVVQFNPEPIVLEAFDSQGNLLDQASTPGNVLVVQAASTNQPISRLVLRGGQHEGVLIQVCLTLIKPVKAQTMRPGNRVFCYRGQYTLDPTEPPGTWSGLLSVQTVNTVPPGTPPVEAARTIGGLESADIAALDPVTCVIVLSLDHLFDVI